MKKIIAVDVGVSKLIVGLVEEDGTVRKTLSKEYDCPYTKQQLVSDIKKFAEIFKNSGAEAIGIVVPGLADNINGIWLSSPFVGITNWSITKELGDFLGLPSFIENDVNALALAELCIGAAKGLENFMWIALSTGVGGAVFLDGRLLHGKRFGVGEIGHIVIEENGFTCSCGNRGCLETACSGRAISKYYNMLTGRSADAKTVAVLAKQGDIDALETYDRVGKSLGRAIAQAVNLLNIDTVILGGGVSRDCDLFIETAEKEILYRVLKTANPKISIIPTKLGYYATLKGAAAVAGQYGNK